MPTVQIYVNIDVPKDTSKPLLKDLSEQLAEALGKPERWMNIVVQPNALILQGGSEDPCGYANIYSIGGIGPKEVNSKVSTIISSLFEKHLKINRDRLYIFFFEKEAKDVGWNGGLFSDLI